MPPGCAARRRSAFAIRRSLRPSASGRSSGDRASSSRRRVPVDRAAVVGVDQRQRDELVALVDVGHARDGQLQQQLAERGALARPRATFAANGSNDSRNGRCS